MRLTARLRRRVSLLLQFCLLFQLAAVSAYACAREVAPSAAMAAMPGMPDCLLAHAKPAAPSALCGQHCAPDNTVHSDFAAAWVPAMPPAVFDWQAGPPPRLDAPHDSLYSRSDPPPRLRFCSLLI